MIIVLLALEWDSSASSVDYGRRQRPDGFHQALSLKPQSAVDACWTKILVKLQRQFTPRMHQNLRGSTQLQLQRTMTYPTLLRRCHFAVLSGAGDHLGHACGNALLVHSYIVRLLLTVECLQLRKWYKF